MGKGAVVTASLKNGILYSCEDPDFLYSTLLYIDLCSHFGLGANDLGGQYKSPLNVNFED